MYLSFCVFLQNCSDDSRMLIDTQIKFCPIFFTFFLIYVNIVLDALPLFTVYLWVSWVSAQGEYDLQLTFWPRNYFLNFSTPCI
jgi:hypothetical protein